MTDTTDDTRHSTPEALAADGSMSDAQKQERLEDWVEDLNAKLRASGENMTGVDSDANGALLQRVLVCLERLRSPT